MLNGGLGVASHLKALNALLVDQARRQFAPIAAADRIKDDSLGYSGLSCDEAIRYLSVAQEATRTGDDEVAFMNLGFGQGMARRIRAELSSIEEQIQAANDSLLKATVENAQLKRRLAVALWHRALELVTTGHWTMQKSSKFSGIWRWRRLILKLTEMSKVNPKTSSTRSIPTLLGRGWRPHQNFAEELVQNRPDFLWADPRCLELKAIPIEVETLELSTAILAAFCEDEQSRPSVESGTCHQRFEIKRQSLPLKSAWNAYLQFKHTSDIVQIHRLSCRVKGIPLPSAKRIPHIEKATELAQEKFDNASAAYTVSLNRSFDHDFCVGNLRFCRNTISIFTDSPLWDKTCRNENSKKGTRRCETWLENRRRRTARNPARRDSIRMYFTTPAYPQFLSRIVVKKRRRAVRL